MEDVLVIEEQASAASLLMGLHADGAWRFESAVDLNHALAWMQKRMFRVVVLDLGVEAGRGESLLSHLKQVWPGTQFVVLTPEGDSQRGLRALKLGAYDTVPSPLEPAHLDSAVRRACERARLGGELRAARLREDDQPFLLGESSPMIKLREALMKAAGHDANGLLSGEVGTGKFLAGRFIHYHSARRKGPFVAVDCADLKDGGEKELFGHGSEPGRLELAAGGVLLLQHVGHLALSCQAKLLRALQDRGFQPPESSYFIPMDVRVLATGPENLRARVTQGAFREDLYWALGATPFEVPTLRARQDDIKALFVKFLADQCVRLGRNAPPVRPEAMEAVQNHAFPGNIAELKALVQVIAVLAQEEVGLADLPVAIFMGEQSEGAVPSLKSLVHGFERQVIVRTLRTVRGNQSRAAERLVVHRNTLILKMQELDIPNKRTQKKSKPRPKLAA